MHEPATFSDYLVFVDESGDHNIIHIDPQFPVFVLLFAVIHKDADVNHVCPDLQQFKFEFCGHDEVVLHEHEIRKPESLPRPFNPGDYDFNLHPSDDSFFAPARPFPST